MRVPARADRRQCSRHAHWRAADLAQACPLIYWRTSAGIV